MHEIKVKCPAKINLTLEILNKREDGFHNIQSVMQTIDLFDILTIKLEKSENFAIKLTGTSNEIPYDESNLVYKAAELFFRCKDAKMQRCKAEANGKWKMENGKCHCEEGVNDLTLAKERSCHCEEGQPDEAIQKSIHHSLFTIHIHIEKNIPIAAGLAGGSTDAAGTLWGLNKLFNNILSDKELHELCAQLGSDLNFCLEGGCQLATSRGEILETAVFQEFRLSLIKPKTLGISAKEAYTKFSELENKPNLNMTEKMIEALKTDKNIQKFLHNDLEIALIEDYQELKQIKTTYPKSLMSGSGSTFFVLENEGTIPVAVRSDEQHLTDFWLKTGLKSIPYGVCEY